MRLVNPKAERVCGGMSTGRFRFSIAQPVRKNHPPARAYRSGLGWCWLPRLRAAAAPLLQSGYIMGYYANILCPAACAPGFRGRLLPLRSVLGALACNVSQAGAPASPTRRRLPAGLGFLGIGAGFRGCRFLLRLNTAAISREHYKLTRVASYYIICDGLQENTKSILKHRAKG